MKKTILAIAVVALISSCATKEEQPTETKEQKESREKIQRLRKSSDSLDRLADSTYEARVHLEEFYDRAIRFTEAGLTEKQAVQKAAENDSVGYALYLISQKEKK